MIPVKTGAPLSPQSNPLGKRERIPVVIKLKVGYTLYWRPVTGQKLCFSGFRHILCLLKHIRWSTSCDIDIKRKW